MVPILFAPSATDFTTNGLGRLNDTVSCKVTEVLNGEYELELVYPNTGRLFTSIRHSSIIGAKPFQNGTVQAFRVYKIGKEMKGLVTVYARHISYQLNYIPCDIFSGQQCSAVLQNMKNAAVEPCPFEFWTNISNTVNRASENLYNYEKYEVGTIDLKPVLGDLLEWEDEFGNLLSEGDPDSLVYDEHATTIWLKCGKSKRYKIRKMLSNCFSIASIDNFPAAGSAVSDLVIMSSRREIEYTTSPDAEYLLIYVYNSDPSLDGDATYNSVMNSIIIQEIGTYSWLMTEPRCIRACLLGDNKNTIQSVYGGEFEWDNYTVKLRANRGSDKGVKIRYGKNLVNLKQEENIENTITGIYPVWYRDGTLVELPEKTLHNWDVVHNFPYRITVIQDFSSDFDSMPTVEELRERATVYIQENNIGIPEVSLEVSFVNLSDTMEYSGIADLQSVNLGDTITVEFPELGVNAKQKVTKTEYDSLSERYISVAIGNIEHTIEKTLEDQMNELSEKITEEDAQTTVDRATGVLNAGAQKGHVIIGRNDNGFANEMYFLDNPNAALAKQVLRINEAGIGFSSTGIRGNYAQAWTLDGHLTLGGVNNANGTLEILDSTGDRIGYWDNHRLHVKGGKIESGQFSSIGNEFYVYEDEETHEVELGWTGWIVEQCTMMSNHMEWESNNHTNPTSGTSASAAINGGSDSGTYSGSGHEGTASFKALWLDDDWYDGESSNYSYTEEGRRSGHLWDVTECLIWLADRVSALERSGGGGGGGGDGSNCGIPSGDSNNCPLPDDSTSCPIIDDSTTCPDNDSSSCGTGDNSSCGGDSSSCSGGGGTCDGPGCGAG